MGIGVDRLILEHKKGRFAERNFTRAGCLALELEVAELSESKVKLEKKKSDR